MQRLSRVITLTTDFKTGSPYVAAMKGVILSINPAATIVDITHDIPPQNVRQGALALSQTVEWFPPDTIHIGVVDPGVGSDRRIIYAQIHGQHFVVPDNGLVSRLALTHRPSTIRHVRRPELWLPEVSNTFHGRDIMAPVAARLSLGLSPEELGPPLEHLVHLAWTEVRRMPGRIEGTVQSIDSFGNLITNITRDQLADVPDREQVRIECDEHETQGIFKTYSDQPDMTFMAVVGSSNLLELAIVGESAAGMLGIPVGSKVVVSW